MWFDPSNPDVIFGDQRRETITVTDRSHGRENGTRTIRIEPDTLLDFRALPYPDNTFRLVAFDPPHLERAGKGGWMLAKYGKLGPDWRDDLRAGFAECFRVLEPEGILVFKWNETQVKTREVLALTDARPLFGQVSGHRAMTHWLVFMKSSGNPTATSQQSASPSSPQGYQESARISAPPIPTSPDTNNQEK